MTYGLGCVVLAGGLATRLGSSARGIAKAMQPVDGVPFLDRLVRQLASAGFDPIVIAVAHHSESIISYFAAQQAPEHAAVRIVETPGGGTSADLMHAVSATGLEQFLVCNGDTVVDIDLRNLQRTWAMDPERALIALSRRKGLPNDGAFAVGERGRVVGSAEAEIPTPPAGPVVWRGSSTGMLVLGRAMLERAWESSMVSLERHLVPDLIRRGGVKVFDNGHRYVLDFGTPERLARLGAEVIHVLGALGRPQDRTPTPDGAHALSRLTL